MMLLAPLFAKLVRFFPPLVTGTVILIIGLSLFGRRRELGRRAAWSPPTARR